MRTMLAVVVVLVAVPEVLLALLCGCFRRFCWCCCNCCDASAASARCRRRGLPGVSRRLSCMPLYSNCSAVEEIEIPRSCSTRHVRTSVDSFTRKAKTDLLDLHPIGRRPSPLSLRLHSTSLLCLQAFADQQRARGGRSGRELGGREAGRRGASEKEERKPEGGTCRAPP